MPRLLIIDDEPNVRFSLERTLRSDNLEVVSADNARNGIAAVKSEAPDAVLLDVRLPDMSGLDAFHQIASINPRLPVVIVTAHGTTDTAIEAMKRGAFDYLLKPFDLRQLRAVVGRAIDASRLQRQRGPQTSADRSGSSPELIVGRSPAMQEVYKAIGRVAVSDVSVLLLGESGTGKELVARAIYQHSNRSHEPFVAINCAAIPETLLESELFGHEKGAFTGADKMRVGKFELAHGGTIFLDEIGDMSGPTQAKVLRLLQEQRFERVGGNETIQTDVRIIAATNQDLEELVRSGRFRRDLFYRLNVYTIPLPPLRERLDDIPPLVDHFVRISNSEVARPVRVVTPEAMDLLKSYLWPGNVRELQGVIKTALVNSSSDVLTPAALPQAIRDGAEWARRVSAESDDALDVAKLTRSLLESGSDDIYRKVLFAVDRVILDEVLGRVDHNQVEASRRLGISRTTLRAKLQNLGRSEAADPGESAGS